MRLFDNFKKRILNHSNSYNFYKKEYEKQFKNASNNKINNTSSKKELIYIEDNLNTINNLIHKSNDYIDWKLNKYANPLVSVILPSFNVKNYIEECLVSVLNQSLKNIEIICVDAGSDDGTLDIIKKYSNKDSRLKLIVSDKKSYGYQMNLGINASSGEYIGIVETDDYISKDMYETLYNLTENGSVDIAKVNFWHLNESDSDVDCVADGTKKNLPVDCFTIYDDANILNGHPSIWAAIYRREFLNAINVKFIEAPGGGWVDNPFFFETFCAATSIKYKDEPHYFYRESNPESSTNNLVDLNLPMKRMLNNFDVLKKYGCTDENVLASFYVRIFWHIRDIFKKENFEKQNDVVCRNIRAVVKRMDRNIVHSYFNESDQKLYENCLTYYNSPFNLLLIASDNNRTSGAFLSMANLCKNLIEKYDVNVKVIVPMKGHGVEVLDHLNIDYDLIPSFDWVIPLSKKRDDVLYNEIHDKKQSNEIAVSDIETYIRENNIDIVHINTTYSYVGALASLNENIPFIWHLREFLEEDQSNTLWDRKLGNELINKANKVIAISDSIYNKYKYIIDKNKLVKIYNGIDAERFYKPNKTIFDDETVKLIMVGGFEYYKGQLEFAEACVKAYNQGLDNFEIWFVGTGNDNVKQQVMNIFSNGGISDKVKYLGYKYDVENYFDKTDISFTCAKSEAFGRTTVEAMLSGNLLIGANTAGTKELIKDFKTGILYEQGNTDDLCNKIIDAIKFKEKSKKIADSGRKYMFENMTAEINADLIYGLYDEILNK